MREDTDKEVEQDVTNPLNCPLYNKCYSVSTSTQLLAEEVTQIKRSEEKASKDRKETSDNIKKIDGKIDSHIIEFNQTAKIVQELKEVVEPLVKSNIKINSNQFWMKLIAYLFGVGVVSCLVALFLHANSTDKTISAINETLKSNTKALEKQAENTEKQNEYWKDVIREFKDLNSKNAEARIKMESKVNQIENYQNRNYGELQGLKESIKANRSK